MSETFITSPVLRSHQTSDVQKKLSFNIRQKIINILKSFTERQLLFQAVNNIGIPKNFINTAFIESRPDEELNKIYNAICALKKEVMRIKRYSDTPQLNNIFALQSIKNADENTNRVQLQKSQNRKFAFLKKQISPQKRIKQAIEQELMYRQKLQSREKKAQQSIKLKAEFNQKRKQAAKSINKKVIEVYQRQKQIQQKWFEKVINSQPQNLQPVSVIRKFQTADTMRTHQLHEIVKSRMEQSKLELENNLHEQENTRLLRQNSLKEFKHRRLASLNQRTIYKRLKSQEIRQRKNNFSHEDETQKIKKMIQKQLKIQQTRQNKNTKHTRISQSQIQTSTLMTTMNLFRNSDVHSIDYTKEDEKENHIFQKIERKNQIRQTLLNSKIQKMKEKHRLEQSRRQAFKRSQMKLLTESNTNNESFIYQKSFKGQIGLLGQVQTPIPDPQQQNIRKKHDTLVKSSLCDQTIMRLRKLPKSILQKKLKDFKAKELRDIFAKNIVQLLN